MSKTVARSWASASGSAILCPRYRAGWRQSALEATAKRPYPPASHRLPPPPNDRDRRRQSLAKPLCSAGPFPPPPRGARLLPTTRASAHLGLAQSLRHRIPKDRPPSAQSWPSGSNPAKSSDPVAAWPPDHNLRSHRAAGAVRQSWPKQSPYRWPYLSWIAALSNP